MGIMIGAIVASQTAMRVAAMNAMKKNLENQKKAVDKQPKVCYTNQKRTVLSGQTTGGSL